MLNDFGALPFVSDATAILFSAVEGPSPRSSPDLVLHRVARGLSIPARRRAGGVVGGREGGAS